MTKSYKIQKSECETPELVKKVESQFSYYTVQEFGDKYGLAKGMANAVILFLVHSGNAEMCAQVKIDGKRGKPANIYKIKSKVNFDFDNSDMLENLQLV